MIFYLIGRVIHDYIYIKYDYDNEWHDLEYDILTYVYCMWKYL